MNEKFINLLKQGVRIKEVNGLFMVIKNKPFEKYWFTLEGEPTLFEGYFSEKVIENNTKLEYRNLDGELVEK